MPEKEEWRLIKYLHEPSDGEAEEYFARFQEAPFGQLLVDTFKTHTDPDSWLVGSGIVGNVTTEGERITPSMRLSLNDPKVTLNIYNLPIDWISRSEWDPIGRARVKAEITSSPEEMNTWRADLGHERRWEIGVRFPGSYGIALPSKSGRWLFKMLADFSQQASEFYDPLREQPTFWDGQDSRTTHL